MEKYFEINGQGHNIRCKMYYRDLSTVSRAVVFCTGFAGHKDNNAAKGFAEKLLSKQKDTAVIVFNWPAHGDDVKKKISLEDCDTYLGMVVDEVKEKYGSGGVYCCAVSFGGYLVLKYISEHGSPFRKIGLRCPAVDMYDVLTKNIMKSGEAEQIARGKDASVGFDRKITVTKDFLDGVRDNDIRQRDYLEYAEDILIVHGTKDEVVPFESGRDFAENNIIEFKAVEGADHRFQNPAHMSLSNKYIMEFFALS